MWSHLPKFTFQTWLGVGGPWLELGAQPPVTLWAGPTAGRVWLPGGLIGALGERSDCSSLWAASASLAACEPPQG